MEETGDFANALAAHCWPEKAVVTAGMPYGNKGLHFGHIGGVFVPADAFARFLRDRIGAENVRFICGTDCFGSPINEGYRKSQEAGLFKGSIEDYVRRNHDAQAKTLKAYDISLSIYEGSGLGKSASIHRELTRRFITRLYENGYLKRRTSLQFWDPLAQTILNGRQVVGRCPVAGCKSEKAYADECDLGHSYAPEDLINPVSTLSSCVPEMKPVENWYFDLPAFKGYIESYTADLEHDEHIRPIVAQNMREFLAPPVIFIKCELRSSYEKIAQRLPTHTLHEAPSGKQSFELEFADIDARDEARNILAAEGIFFRTGKALVPFRITGNIEWGVKAPEIEGLDNLTVWCWPESLWAPISFTIAANDYLGLPEHSWRDFWCSDTSRVYQFIGQDNLYFYGVAQPALFEALRPGNFMDKKVDIDSKATSCGGEANDELRQTTLIANHHLLFGSKKASSSGAVKPPSADELLQYYDAEHLRAHFLALALDQKSVGFKPKAFDPDPSKRNDTRIADPVMKEGTLLTNVFNRLARSCFYEAQNNFGQAAPLGEPSKEVKNRAHEALLAYDEHMLSAELHRIMNLNDEFIRYANKYWADGISAAQRNGDEELRRAVLRDAFYLLRISCLMMHPVVPAGCERICEKLDFDAARFFSWDASFESLDELCSAEERARGFHGVKALPARFDFFPKFNPKKTSD